MSKTLFFFLFSIYAQFIVFSQKKVIDHTAYDKWKQLKNEQISTSGRYITYEIAPLKGDTYLYYHNTTTNKLDSIERAKNAQFSYDEKHLIYVVEAGYDTLRKAELAKIDKKKYPKDSLAILYLTDGDSTKRIIKISNVKSHQVGEKHPWLSYLMNDNNLTEKKKTKRKYLFFKEKAKKLPEKSNGNVLYIWNLKDDRKYSFKNVVDYELSEYGKQLVYVQHLNDSCTVSLLDLSQDKTTVIEEKFSDIQHPTFDKKAHKLVFLASMDTTKTKIYNLFFYDINGNHFSCLADTTTHFLSSNWTVSKNKQPRFSDIHDRLYFGVFETPEPEKKDTILDSEKPKLDLWHYNESILQSRQIKRLKSDLNKAYWHAYDFSTGEIIALENDTLSLQKNFYELENYALSSNTQPYELEFSWTISGKRDYYICDLHTGKHTVIKKGVSQAIDLSRKGDKFVYFDDQHAQYYIIDLNNKRQECITCDLSDKTWSENKNGMPTHETAIGNLGWNKLGTQVFLKEKNDFFVYHTADSSEKQGRLENLTRNIGSQQGIEFNVRQWNTDSTFSNIDNFYLIGLDKNTKGTHLYSFQEEDLIFINYWDAKITSGQRAKKSEKYILRKQTVVDYPEIYFFEKNSDYIRQISVTNPQQYDYLWAKVEQFKWKNYGGDSLDGLIYFPENFDSTLSYPLLVYYYELNSDNLHNHSHPRPTASIIHTTEYASAGYVVFIPDIRYEVGRPAKSAYNCIMSGTDAVLKSFPNIDSNRMGLQGQSWGGYQTAQLITMTNRYKCAMAGAPVGNMFSAFGGIRWATGMSRQFQYEKTQSRIGSTIWNAPELYIENSPIFHLPNVTTPLLIMHNDQDGAVPWYQGIEIFMGMRRLGKPCWLLNYNGDGHNLMKTANRIDLSIRMRQFFDHYLQNKPAPQWLTEGIPATKKGKELRYKTQTKKQSE